MTLPERRYRLRSCFDGQEKAAGTFIFSPDAAHTEIAALGGADFVIIDTEHAPLAMADVLAHIRAAELAAISPIVRLRHSDPADAGRMLDAGAHGLMLPHVGLDLARTRATLAGMRYAPQGRRPACTGVRSAEFGLADFTERAAAANRDTIAIGIIEDAEVVHCIDEVLEACALDAVMAGPADLAASLGRHGQLNHPEVTAAVDRVVAAAKRRPGVKLGVYLIDPQAALGWTERGADFFVYSIDYRVLVRGYEAAFGTLRAAAGTDGRRPDEDQQRPVRSTATRSGRPAPDGRR